MKLVLFLALLGLASAAEDAGRPIEKALDQAHLAAVTGGDLKALEEVDCYSMSGQCKECVRLGHCRYSVPKNDCFDVKDQDGFKNDVVASTSDACPVTTPGPLKIDGRAAVDRTAAATPAATASSDTTTPAADNTTTTTTPPTTTTTAAPNTTTTTTTASTTTTGTTTSTSAPNTTTTASTTPRPTPTTTPGPDPRTGNRFDGWSFFGGMLLTIGLSSIGYVSWRYYKVRTGQAETNYNRF